MSFFRIWTITTENKERDAGYEDTESCRDYSRRQRAMGEEQGDAQNLRSYDRGKKCGKAPCAKAERVYVPGCSSTVWLSVIDAPMLLYQLAECAPPCTAVSLQESVVALFWPQLLTLTVQGLSLAHRSVSNPLSFSRDSAASFARAAGVSASSMVSAKSRLYTRRQKVVCIFT